MIMQSKQYRKDVLADIASIEAQIEQKEIKAETEKKKKKYKKKKTEENKLVTLADMEMTKLIHGMLIGQSLTLSSDPSVDKNCEIGKFLRRGRIYSPIQERHAHAIQTDAQKIAALKRLCNYDSSTGLYVFKNLLGVDCPFYPGNKIYTAPNLLNPREKVLISRSPIKSDESKWRYITQRDMGVLVAVPGVVETYQFDVESIVYVTAMKSATEYAVKLTKNTTEQAALRAICNMGIANQTYFKTNNEILKDLYPATVTPRNQLLAETNKILAREGLKGVKSTALHQAMMNLAADGIIARYETDKAKLKALRYNMMLSGKFTAKQIVALTEGIMPIYVTIPVPSKLICAGKFDGLSYIKGTNYSKNGVTNVTVELSQYDLLKGDPDLDDLLHLKTYRDAVISVAILSPSEDEVAANREIRKSYKLSGNQITAKNLSKSIDEARDINHKSSLGDMIIRVYCDAIKIKRCIRLSDLILTHREYPSFKYIQESPLAKLLSSKVDDVKTALENWGRGRIYKIVKGAIETHGSLRDAVDAIEMVKWHVFMLKSFKVSVDLESTLVDLANAINLLDGRDLKHLRNVLVAQHPKARGGKSRRFDIIHKIAEPKRVSNTVKAPVVAQMDYDPATIDELVFDSLDFEESVA